MTHKAVTVGLIVLQVINFIALCVFAGRKRR